MDLHAGQIQGFFDIPVDHMTALPLFAQYFRDKGLSGESVVSVSPDPGRAKMARKFGQMLECDMAVMNKTRPAHDQAAISQVIGDVTGKVALMGDDMIVTGGTLIAAAAALKEAGAVSVHVFATHGHFAGNAMEKLAGADLAEIVVTDTVPIDTLNQPEMLAVLPVSGLLAETILSVFTDGSVSEIFSGENQLF
jgi:ribose-phosphate pyrophosphokinase